MGVRAGVDGRKADPGGTGAWRESQEVGHPGRSGRNRPANALACSRQL